MATTQAERDAKFKKLKEKAGKCGEDIMNLVVTEKYPEEVFALTIAILYELMPTELEYTKRIAFEAHNLQEKKKGR